MFCFLPEISALNFYIVLLDSLLVSNIQVYASVLLGDGCLLSVFVLVCSFTHIVVFRCCFRFDLI